MSLAEKVGTGEVVTLLLADIKPGPKVRAERVYLDRVTALENVLDQVDPIKVGWPRKVAIDGAHRMAAHNRKGLRSIRCILVSAPSEDDEYDLAVEANNRHGLPYTLEERESHARRKVNTSDWSDRRIAEWANVDERTVAKMRPRPGAGNGATGQPEKRQGKDGNRYPANRNEQAEKVDAELDADPDASARDIAKRTGASPTTVSNRKKAKAAGLSLVPPTTTEPSAADFVLVIPDKWAKEEACNRTDAGREFARWMDRSVVKVKPRGGVVRLYDDGFAPHVAHVPAELRRAAISEAKRQADAWASFASALEADQRIEGVQ